eukprot:UN06119
MSFFSSVWLQLFPILKMAFALVVSPVLCNNAISSFSDNSGGSSSLIVSASLSTCLEISDIVVGSLVESKSTPSSTQDLSFFTLSSYISSSTASNCTSSDESSSHPV